MANKLIFAVLGLLCLLPALYAAPSSSSQESSEEMSTKSLVERIKLLALTLEEFADLYTVVVEKGPQILNKVLEDPKIIEVKTEEMEKGTKIIRDYLEKFEKNKKAEKKAHIFELVEEYDDVLVNFDSNQHELTPEAALIEKSLEEHGLSTIKESINDHFTKFLKKFSAEIEPYIEKLDEKERKDEQKLIEWYEKLKAEKDVDEQIVMFDNFIEVEDD